MRLAQALTMPKLTMKETISVVEASWRADMAERIDDVLIGDAVGGDQFFNNEIELAHRCSTL
jgi:hypothetical protein